MKDLIAIPFMVLAIASANLALKMQLMYDVSGLARYGYCGLLQAAISLVSVWIAFRLMVRK